MEAESVKQGSADWGDPHGPSGREQGEEDSEGAHALRHAHKH